MNHKGFNLLSKTNETAYVSTHETSADKCRLDASVYKQRWNNDKNRCELRELIYEGRCDDRLLCNSST